MLLTFVQYLSLTSIIKKFYSTFTIIFAANWRFKEKNWCRTSQQWYCGAEFTVETGFLSNFVPTILL